MERLDKDWITSGLIDFEYKKYLLLAYMQHVDSNFKSVKLYPDLSELAEHYHAIQDLKTNKSSLSDDWKKDLSHIDWERYTLAYNDAHADSDTLKSISEILEYAIPHFEKKIETGRHIFEFVEENLSIEPVGLLPIYKDEGYLLLEDDLGREILVYKYKSTLIESSREKYRALKTQFLLRERKSIGRTFEQLKLSLTKKFDHLPNPATWLIHSEMRFPLVETFLPVTKRLLMKELHEA